MTREEEIYEAWRKSDFAFLPDFAGGANWADEHPKNPWISVEERLPPIKIRVLFLDKNGKIWFGRNTIAMQAELETDENNNLLPPPTVPPAKPTITHWMPIPELKGGGKVPKGNR